MGLSNLKKYKTKTTGAYKRKVQPGNARHQAGDPDWITPPDTLDVERAMWAELGLEIDLDPYSSEIANKVVRAKRFFTEADDGFAQPHCGEAVHVNHPGGTTKRAWKKFVDEIHLGNTKRACWIGFSIEQPCVLADPLDADEPLSGYPHCSDFSMVFLRSRIDFYKEATLAPGGRPGHANYIVLVNVPREIVDKHWGPFGRVFHGPLAI